VTTSPSDRIETTLVLPHSREKVWRAISEAQLFGEWIGLCDHGEFACGEWFTAKMAPTRFSAEFAKLQEPHRGLPVKMWIARIDPMAVFCFRFHPFAVDPHLDYSHEPMNEVAFVLQDSPDGTRVTITESGFDQIPPDRRAQAYAINERGWSLATQALESYLIQTA
jgi:uncharacterized protein YndB with AHSA1/START domain